jgi:hypothetical protein
VSSKTIPATERVQVVTQDLVDRDALTLYAEESGPDLRVFSSQDDEGEGIPFRAGDEIPVEEEEGWLSAGTADGLWMETETAEVQTVTVLKGVALKRNPRRNTRTSGVVSPSGESPPAASDEFVEEQGTGVDVNAATETVDIVAPGRADSITISVDDAAGGFDVALKFRDGSGNTVTTRDKDNSSDYSGDGTTDVFVTAPVAAQDIRVEISDTSGAANALDYSIYVR